MSELNQNPNSDDLVSNSSFTDVVDKMVYWSKLFGVLSWICGILCIIGGLAVFVTPMLGVTNTKFFSS